MCVYPVAAPRLIAPVGVTFTGAEMVPGTELMGVSVGRPFVYWRERQIFQYHTRDGRSRDRDTPYVRAGGAADVQYHHYLPDPEPWW